MEQLIFLREFLKHWREVGSVTPSSSFLIRRLLNHIDPATATRVVELGGGIGTITEPLLKRLGRGSHLFVFEVNEQFCAKLRCIPDARLTVLPHSAETMSPVLVGGETDYIVSSLPLSTFDGRMLQKILSAIQATLSKDGVFVQYQYAPLAYPALARIFEEVTVSFEPRNVPPAFVYACRKVRKQYRPRRFHSEDTPRACLRGSEE